MSSDEEVEEVFALFDDMVPLSENLEELTFVKDYYSPYQKKVFDLFRRVIQTKEVSLRSFKLSKAVIGIETSIFTAYYHRRQCFEQLTGLSEEEELQYMDSLLTSNQKNFQIWEHRKFLVLRSRNYQREFDSILTVHNLDSKNYHCWVYRKWLCDTFDLFESEKQAIEAYLGVDVMNNSAWTYRFYLYNRGELRGMQSKAFIQQEIDYVKEKLTIEPRNEAAWNYINGYFPLFDLLACSLQGLESAGGHLSPRLKYADFPLLEKIAEVIFATDCKDSFAGRTLAAALWEKGESEAALKVLEALCAGDPTRKHYYLWLGVLVKKARAL